MRDTVRAMEERVEVVGSGTRDADARVRALRTAYDARQLCVTDDSGALARARLSGGRAIDARDVAAAILRELLRPRAHRRLRA